jgi:hypothetical protein
MTLCHWERIVPRVERGIHGSAFVIADEPKACGCCKRSGGSHGRARRNRERSKLPLDEAQHLPLVIPLGRRKRFQLASHDLIEERLYGITRPVGGIGDHE